MENFNFCAVSFVSMFFKNNKRFKISIIQQFNVSVLSLYQIPYHEIDGFYNISEYKKLLGEPK